MANDNVNYAKKINEAISDMPDFVTDFIYNFGKTENYTTKYQYLLDLRDFFRFMVNYMPEHCEKEFRAITLADMDSIKPLDINRYLSLLQADKKTGLSPATVKRRRATLSSMYSFLLSNEKVSKNPVLATKTINIPDKGVVYLTDEEQALLLSTVQSGHGLAERTADLHDKYAERDSAMFLLLLDTGLRVSEMLSTDICDYDLEKGSVIVTRKGGDIDIVFYSNECAEYLDSYFSAQKVRFYVEGDNLAAFTTLTGARLGKRAVETLVKKYVSACMPDKARLISPHKLRSSFAMSFYDASKKDILLLQKKLHHKSINTTNIYAKASNKESEDSRNLLAERRNSARKMNSHNL